MRYDLPGATAEPTPTREAPTPTPIPQVQACNPNTFGVNVRSMANTSGSVLTVLAAGDCLPLASDASSWWTVWLDNRMGYVAGWLLERR